MARARVNVDELIGLKVGRLTVLRPAYRDSNGKWYVVCGCECGKELPVRASNVKSGNSQSCGCGRKEWVKSGAAFKPMY